MDRSTSWPARPAACPSCGSAKTRVIVWGMPSPADLDDPRRPDWVDLGGCLIEEFDRYCEACDFVWAKDDDADTRKARLRMNAVRDFVRGAHHGQVDRLGRDYFEAHVEPVASELAHHGPLVVMAGYLRDVLEDTDTLIEDLVDLGVPIPVIVAVDAMTRRPGEPDEKLLARAAADPIGRMVELAVVMHGLGLLDRLAGVDPTGAARLREKYEHARGVLLGGATVPR